MNKYETAIIKCIAKGCKNKVIIKLKVTDSDNAGILFFKFCSKHQKQFNNKIKQDYKNKDKVKKDIIKASSKEVIKAISKEVIKENN